VISPEPDIGRRTLLKASAWGVPVIAAAVATPLAAASTPTDYELRVITPVVVAGSVAQLQVSFPASALPIASGSTFVQVTRASGTGGISAYGHDGTWSTTWTNSTRMAFIPPSSPQLEGNPLAVYFYGPGVWDVVLSYPGGVSAGQISVI